MSVLYLHTQYNRINTLLYIIWQEKAVTPTQPVTTSPDEQGEIDYQQHNIVLVQPLDSTPMKQNIVEENNDKPSTIPGEKTQDQEPGEGTAQVEKEQTADNQGDIQADTNVTSTPIVEDLEVEIADPQIASTVPTTSIESSKDADITQTDLDKAADSGNMNETGETMKGQSTDVNTHEKVGVSKGEEEMKVESIQSVEFNKEKEEQISDSNVQTESGTKLSKESDEKSNSDESKTKTCNPDKVSESHITSMSTSPLKPLPNLDSTLVVARSEPRLPLLPAKHPLVSDELLKSQSAVILGTGPEKLANSMRTPSETDTDRKSDASKPKRLRASSSKGSLKSTSSLKERAKSRESLRSTKLKSRSESKLSRKRSTKSVENVANIGSSSKLSISKESLKVASQVYGSTTIKQTSSNNSVRKESGHLSSKSRDSFKKSVTELPPNKTEEENEKVGGEENTAIDVASTKTKVDSKISPSPEVVEVMPEDEPSNEQIDNNVPRTSKILNKPDDSSSVGVPVTTEEEKSTAQNNMDTVSQTIDTDLNKTKSSSSVEHENDSDRTPSSSQVLTKILESKRVEIDHHTGQPSSEKSIKVGKNVAPDSNEEEHAENEPQAPIVQNVVAAV